MRNDSARIDPLIGRHSRQKGPEQQCPEAVRNMRAGSRRQNIGQPGAMRLNTHSAALTWMELRAQQGLRAVKRATLCSHPLCTPEPGKPEPLLSASSPTECSSRTMGHKSSPSQCHLSYLLQFQVNWDANGDTMLEPASLTLQEDIQQHEDSYLQEKNIFHANMFRLNSIYPLWYQSQEHFSCVVFSWLLTSAGRLHLTEESYCLFIT